MKELLGQYIISLATQLPVIIVYFAGLILAFIWRQRHQKASLYVMLGSALLLLNILLMSGAQVWLSGNWLARTHTGWNVSSIFYALGLLRSVIGAAGAALLLAAAFTGRSDKQRSQV